MRALLNVYGFPPDLIPINEYGGSTSAHNPIILDNTPHTFNVGMNNVAGNVSYIKEHQVHHMMHFSRDIHTETGRSSIQIPWNQGFVNGMWDPQDRGIELNVIPTPTTQSSTLILSSGSYDETRWQLKYIPSASDSPTIGYFHFENNYESHGAPAASASGALSPPVPITPFDSIARASVALARNDIRLLL